jgi:hypothetical protein
METVIKYICNHSKLCPDKEGCRHSVEHIPDYDCSELCGDKTSQCVPYYYLKSKMNLVMLLHEQGYFLTYQEQLEITGWLKEHDESCLQSHDRELKEALKEAVEIIKIFHGEPAWEIYYNCSPEMKRIRAILERNGD